MTSRNPVIRRARPASQPPRGTVGTLNVTDSILPSYLVEKAATVVPSSYPSGWSVMSIAADTSWPLGTTDGLVETWVTGAGATGYRIKQTYTGQAGFLVFHRYGATNDTWASWQLVTPYTAWSDTATAYNIALASTWEVAHTVTITVLPSTRFDATITGNVQGRTFCPNSRTDLVRVRISRDGGTTFATGRAARSGPIAASQNQAFAAMDSDSGAVTGNIVVRLEVNSDDAATSIDDMYVDVRVQGSH